MKLPVSDLFRDILAKVQSSDPIFALLIQLINSIPPDNYFLSGGALRDVLAGNNFDIKDIDIFLTETGFEKINEFLLQNGRLTTNQFGSYRWFPGDSDKFYYDVIIIQRFYNGLWPCRNITDVLNQFDITANAVAMDLSTGDLHNPQNGLDDIQKKVLRAVRFDFPELPVSNDMPISRISVLWFRYNYYARRLGFEIEPLTLKWINENSYRAADLDKFKTYFFDPHK